MKPTQSTATLRKNGFSLTNTVQCFIEHKKPFSYGNKVAVFTSSCVFRIKAPMMQPGYTRVPALVAFLEE